MKRRVLAPHVGSGGPVGGVPGGPPPAPLDPLRAFVAANPRQRGRLCWVCGLTQEVDGHRLVDLINQARTQEPPILVPEIVRFLVQRAGIDPALPIEGRLGIHYQRQHHLRGER